MILYFPFPFIIISVYSRHKVEVLVQVVNIGARALTIFPPS